jgi:hypothetical protein
MECIRTEIRGGKRWLLKRIENSFSYENCRYGAIVNVQMMDRAMDFSKGSSKKLNSSVIVTFICALKIENYS